MPLEVLVVDDIPASRQSLCALVSDLGHHPVEAGNGAAALARVQAQPPDVVLLDLLMPGLDGFEVTRRVRDCVTDRWLPVIVISGLQGDEHFIQALMSGADDYLARPVNAALLDAKLRHYARVLALQVRLSMQAQHRRDILDNMLDPVLILDADGHVLELNRAAASLADAEGRPILPGLPCEAVLGRPLASLRSRHECVLRRVDGSSFPAEPGLSEWHEDGALRHTLVLRDLSERRQIERMKDEFLAIVSHELRTPLTSVLGAVGLLAGGAAGALPAAALPLADVARRNGERLSRLIDDILDLTKLEGDRLVLRPRPQRIAALLHEALAAQHDRALRAGVTLVADGLDGAAADTTVWLDGDRFLQALGNLLSNAIQHSPAGEVVRLALEATAQGVRITVRDRGPGVAPALRARLFEKFVQGDGTDHRTREGAGLGLYISRMLVERMGGRIACDDAPGPGAAFSLSFPAAEPPLAQAPCVLHVDSDHEVRERVARWLTPRFSVDSAASLLQAETLARARPPALVIGNPQSQGAADEFCSALSRLTGQPAVLLYGDSIDAAFSQRLGLRWLSPARSGPEDLLAAVHDALQGADPGSRLPAPRTTRSDTRGAT